MFDASAVMPRKTKQKHKHVPGWNKYCKELYKISRDKFLQWRNGGKFLSSTIFDEIKASRSAFKSGLKFCRNIVTRKNNILDKFNYADKLRFWK